MSKPYASESPSAIQFLAAAYRALMIFGAILLIAVSSWLESCESNPRIDIASYDAVVRLDSEGDMHVTETWVMDYRDALRVRFRDIDYDKHAPGNPFDLSSSNNASFDTSSLSVRITKDGRDVTSDIRIGTSYDHDRDELGNYVACEPYRQHCASVFTDFMMAGGLEGNVTFEYGYVIEGVITEYIDISEFNWVMLEYAEATIERFKVDVYVPEHSHGDDHLMAWGHGLADGTVTVMSSNHVRFEGENIKDGNFLEMRVLAGTDLFPSVRDKNKVIDTRATRASILAYEDDLVRETNLRIWMARATLAGTGLVMLMTLGLYMLAKKRWFDPSVKGFERDYFREPPSDHSPAEVGYMMRYGKTTPEDVTATFLDLIRRGHVRIVADSRSTGSYDQTFELSDAPLQDALLPHESALIRWFFKDIGKNGRVSSYEIEHYGSYDHKKAQAFITGSNRFRHAVRARSESAGFLDSDLPQKKAKARLLAWFPAMTLLFALVLSLTYGFNVLLSLSLHVATITVYLIMVNRQKRRSDKGETLYLKWNAFKRYLEHFGEFSDDPIGGIAVWEHYLVYATAFGIADTVMEQLKVKWKDSAPDASGATFMRGAFLDGPYRNRHVMRSMDRRIRTAHSVSHGQIRSHRQSQRRQAFVSGFSKTGSYGGRGGGFSGGSSFGGGGGGGRSR